VPYKEAEEAVRDIIEPVLCILFAVALIGWLVLL
jgi:hypothetical protein